MEPDIIFEDKHLLVLYKPAGVPVESARPGVQDCVSILKNHIHSQDPKCEVPYLGLIHRLDQPVEGLLVFALDKKTAAGLSGQNADGGMWKTYLAVRWINPADSGQVEKEVEKSGSEVDKWTRQVDYLWKDGRMNRSFIVSANHPGAKRAALSYRVLSRAGDRELLEIRLETGRHHQIRVQMAGLGTPIEGDLKYGPVKTGDKVDKVFPALCAYRLSFVHPASGKRMEFKKTPENPAFSEFLSIL